MTWLARNSSDVVKSEYGPLLSRSFEVRRISVVGTRRTYIGGSASAPKMVGGYAHMTVDWITLSRKRASEEGP